jgi:hypothetical protein
VYTQTDKRGANHVFHAIMTVLTCGMWGLFVWPIAAMIGRKSTTSVQYAPPVQYPVQYQAPPQYLPQVPPHQAPVPPGHNPYMGPQG